MVVPLRRVEIGVVEVGGSSWPEVVRRRRERVLGRASRAAMEAWRVRMELLGRRGMLREGSPENVVIRALIIVDWYVGVGIGFGG